MKNDHVPHPSAIFVHKESCRESLEGYKEKNRREAAVIVFLKNNVKKPLFSAHFLESIRVTRFNAIFGYIF